MVRRQLSCISRPNENETLGSGLGGESICDCSPEFDLSLSLLVSENNATVSKAYISLDLE